MAIDSQVSTMDLFSTEPIINLSTGIPQIEMSSFLMKFLSCVQSGRSLEKYFLESSHTDDHWQTKKQCSEGQLTEEEKVKT